MARHSSSPAQATTQLAMVMSNVRQALKGGSCRIRFGALTTAHDRFGRAHGLSRGGGAVLARKLQDADFVLSRATERFEQECLGGGSLSGARRRRRRR